MEGDQLAATITRLFNGEFLRSENTRLEGGAEEPLYLPETPGAPAQIRFRADYASSALHEIAHWCIAGEARRREVDYGYWYAPDGRDAAQQQRFMVVEARPQAIERVFSEALGLRFRPSLDNLDAPPTEAEIGYFATCIDAAMAEFLRRGLPARAARFLGVLRQYRAAQAAADSAGQSDQDRAGDGISEHGDMAEGARTDRAA